MPQAPKRPCSWPGCAALTDGGRCEKHRKQQQKHIDMQRGSAASRGYGARWQRVRSLYLAKHPLCAECQRNNRLTAASVVDHIKPHKGDQALFWDESNWQALCKHCHDSKTAREDGRWTPGGGLNL